jgi:hypothetical protein
LIIAVIAVSVKEKPIAKRITFSSAILGDLSWHGFHAARRGLGSNLYRLGVPDKTMQAILRHSNVNVTLGYYVKSSGHDVLAGMKFRHCT